MDKINPVGSTAPVKTFEERVSQGNEKKKNIARSFLNNAGIFATAFLVFAVIIIATTDISFKSFDELAALGLDFFLLFFISFSAYVFCNDSGSKGGINSKLYQDAIKRHEVVKRKIIDSKQQGNLDKFCADYVKKEFIAVRTEILAAAGIDLEYYEANYIALSKREVNSLKISDVKKKAIIRANSIKPVRLTADMLMQCGRTGGRRAPLGMSPKARKNIDFTIKFIKSAIITVGISGIMLDVIITPSWTIFATCCLKLLSVLLNIFGGYKSGYENIVIDTVNYITDQADLLEEAYNEVK